MNRPIDDLTVVFSSSISFQKFDGRDVLILSNI